MSNGVFTSGDLSTAASRRIPAPSPSLSLQHDMLSASTPARSPSIPPSSPNVHHRQVSSQGEEAPTPLWARFSKSSSSFLNTEPEPPTALNASNHGTSVSAPSPRIPASSPAFSHSQQQQQQAGGPASFLRVDTVTPPGSAEASKITYNALAPPTLTIGERQKQQQHQYTASTGHARGSSNVSAATSRIAPAHADTASSIPKNDNDAFSCANLQSSPTAEPRTSPAPYSNITSPNTSKHVDPARKQLPPPAAKPRRPSVGLMGSRIISAFRSNSNASYQSQSSDRSKVQSISVPASPPAVEPAVKLPSNTHQAPLTLDLQTASHGATLFASPESARSFMTAREQDSEIGHGRSHALEVHHLSAASGQPAALPTASVPNDRPASPEIVLRRTQEPTQPENAVRLIAGEPPTASGKALDVLLGLPTETPAKAIATLTGIKVVKKPDVSASSGNAFHPRNSVFSVRSEASTVGTTYREGKEEDREGKEDADESDIDTITSALGHHVPGAMPREKRTSAASQLPSLVEQDREAARLAWNRERERKASGQSTASDSSAAAVFAPPPPVPSIPSRLLATGSVGNTSIVAGNGSGKRGATTTPLLRQAISSATTSKYPSAVEHLHTTVRPNGRERDAHHDAMTDDGHKPLKMAAGISLASFENAISDRENNSNRDDDATPRQSENEARGGKLPSSVLAPRARPTQMSKAAKRTSKALSEAPSVTSQAREGTRKTLASIYIVAGLPKDPNNWSLAENDANSGAGEPAHMENAVPRWFKAEVLGTMVSGGGEQALDALEGFQGRTVSGSSRAKELKKKAKGAKAGALPMTTIQEQPTLTKEEIAKIQAKAIKLSLPRDVEIIAAGTPPPATSHTFSFTVKASNTDTVSRGSLKGALGESWDLALAQAARPASMDREDTIYYGASLVVWTHADKTRTDAIRSAIEIGSRVRSLAIARAAKAAAAGRRFGERLARQQAGPAGVGRPRTGGSGHVTSGGETEVETEAYVESEWEGGGAAPLHASVSQLPFLRSSTFWLPYALTLVSKYPIYDLLTDTLRLSWARYHLNISRHSLTMRKLLEFPAPRPSERFKIPVDPLAEAEGAFVMRFPGNVSMNSVTTDIDFQIWPVLRCLDADNLLRIADIALSPFGRIVFFCQHVYMLNLAVETFRHLLEPRGWKGIMHGVVHARDIKVYMEDPGPFLIGIDSRCINLAKEIMDSEICYVDLDTNDVRCMQPPPGALSKGVQREKLVKRLSDAIGNVGHYGVPVELSDAFPGSRFRPFSQVEVNGRVAPAERLLPPANWNYQQDRFLSVFDAVISVQPNVNVIQRLLHLKGTVRKAVELTPNAQHVQQIVRNQSNNFVDKRDLMEAKLWKMNKRLALLMQESQSWNSQFTHFQSFTEKLNSEASELRTKLEKERREAKRLSGVVTESKQKQDELSKKLAQAETAHSEAMNELERIEDLRRELQEQRDVMFSEMTALASAAEDADMLEAIAVKLESKAETWSARSRPSFSAPSKTCSRSLRSSVGLLGTGNSNGNGRHSRARNLSTASTATTPTLTELTETQEDGLAKENDEEEELELADEDEYLEASAMQRMAISETMRSIQEKLQTALANAQARARSATLLTPPPNSRPGVHSPQALDQSGPASPAISAKSLPMSVAAQYANGLSDDNKHGTARVNRETASKKKSRTVVGQSGSHRKVDVPSSASESDNDTGGRDSRTSGRASLRSSSTAAKEKPAARVNGSKEANT